MPLQAAFPYEAFVPCLVRCKHCECAFVYERHFSGADPADLAEMLSHFDIHDPVPCPDCFHYQPYMFPQVGYAAHDNLGCVSGLLLIGGVLVGVGAGGYAALAGGSSVAPGVAAGGGGAALVGWLLERYREHLVKHHDPHDTGTLALRQHVARARAIRLSEYDARQAERAARTRAERAGGRGPVVADWWLTPAVFNNGGTVTVALPSGERYTAEVSDSARLGDVVPAHADAPGAEPLSLRLWEVRLHPDEYQVD